RREHRERQGGERGLEGDDTPSVAGPVDNEEHSQRRDRATDRIHGHGATNPLDALVEPQWTQAAQCSERDGPREKRRSAADRWYPEKRYRHYRQRPEDEQQLRALNAVHDVGHGAVGRADARDRSSAGEIEAKLENENQPIRESLRGENRAPTFRAK